MTGAVDWQLAARVAGRVCGAEPYSSSYHYDSLGPDFTELTAQAEELVAIETGLRSLAGPARAVVVGRQQWIEANVASFERLLGPTLAKLQASSPSTLPLTVAGKVAGVEVGTLLGFMSSKVLGQYDVLVVTDDGAHEADVVYYVGPNVLSLEKRFGFPPREFRLWLALHEVTHRAQFTGVPWMRDHYLGLVTQALGAVSTDPKALRASLQRALSPSARKESLDEGGLMALFAGPEQRALLGQIGGLMSLLEGHGDVTMDRAGAGSIPGAARFGRVLRQRRSNVTPFARVVRRLLGLEAKLAQYEQGERFIAAVEAVAGPRAIDRCWEGPANLPSLDEIRVPEQWLARMDLSALVA